MFNDFWDPFLYRFGFSRFSWKWHHYGTRARFLWFQHHDFSRFFDIFFYFFRHWFLHWFLIDFLMDFGSILDTKNYQVTTLRLPRRRLVPHRPLSLHFLVIFQDFRINFKNLHDFLWNLTLLEAIWKIFWMNFLLHWRPNASKRIISSLGPERALPQALRSAPGPQAPRACLDISRAPSSFLFFF